MQEEPLSLSSSVCAPSRRDFLRTCAVSTAAAVPFLRTGKARAAVQRPNILLVFPDQLRFDWTGLNPDVPVRTPNLVRLAEEGSRFETAFCPSPVCAPSRACLALGRQYGRTGVAGNEDNLADGMPTLYSRLRDAGYRVGSTGKLDLRKAAHDWGEDGMHRVNGHVYFNEWGFTDGLDSEGKGDSLRGVKKREGSGDPFGTSPYTKMLTDRKDGSLETYLKWWEDCRACPLPANNYSYTTPVPLADEAYNDNWCGQNALTLIENFPQDAPWFLQVNFPGPHAPLDITPVMAGWYEKGDFRQPFHNDQLPAEVHTAIRRNYSAMVENIDRWLGKYVDALENRSQLHNTVIIFSSDHGEMLGDHNRWAKTMPYHPSACVPLVFRGPDVPAGKVHRAPAATLDMTATCLDYAGLATQDDMDSRSLRPLLAGNASAARSHVTSGLKDWRLVCDGRYKLVRGFDPDNPEKATAESASKLDSAESPMFLLFDLEDDPHEATNLAAKRPKIVERLAKLLPAT